MEQVERIELSFSAWKAPVIAIIPYLLKWSWRRELNPQPIDYKSIALPLCYASIIYPKVFSPLFLLATGGGVDPHHIPMTSCFQDTVRRRPQSPATCKSQASIGAIFVSYTYIILLVASGGYCYPHLKKHWRTGRDSNSRTGFEAVYRLSRSASSANLSTRPKELGTNKSPFGELFKSANLFYISPCYIDNTIICKHSNFFITNSTAI